MGLLYFHCMAYLITLSQKLYCCGFITFSIHCTYVVFFLCSHTLPGFFSTGDWSFIMTAPSPPAPICRSS